MNADAILDLLGPWVARATGLEVHGALPEASQPQGPHVVLNVTAADIVGGQPVDVCYELVPDATEEPALEISINLWEWTVSVDVYATDAMKRAALVKTWASSAAGLLDLLPLTVSGTSSVRLMPETAEGQWDGRAQLDITLRGYVRDGVPVDLIETVTVDCSRNGGDTVSADETAPCEPVGSITVNKP